MPSFKFVVNEAAKTFQVEKDQGDCPVFGKKIGDVISGDFLGLSGAELKITGGSDKDGFPMRKDVEGVSRRNIVLTKGIGFSGSFRGKKKIKRPHDGARKRKTVRGNTIAADVIQINCSITKKGEKSAAEVFGKSEKTPEEKKE